MKRSRCSYEVVRETDEALTIKDIGPWDQFMSVTNGAEDVVEELVASGVLRPGKRLFYYDSEGQLDELVVKDGKFVEFKPGPRP